MAELRAFLLAVVLGMMWSSGSTSDIHPDQVEVGGPPPSSFSMASCVRPSVAVRFYEMTVKGSNSDAKYRRVAVSDERFKFAVNETIDFSAADTYKCAEVVTAEGLEAFSYDGTCTGYRLPVRFLSCATGEVVLYVRTDHLDDKPSMVPFDEAPQKFVETGPSPYYMFMAHDVTLIEDQGYIVSVPQRRIQEIYLTAAREKGDFLIIPYDGLDPYNCFTDNANGVPVYMYSETVTLISDVVMQSTIYFLNECGQTLYLNTSGDKFFTMYSHAGVGCTHYPGDAPEECSVTLEGTTSMRVTVNTYNSDHNTECGGLDLNLTAWSTTSEETESPETCDRFGMYSLNNKNLFDRITISIPRRPLTPSNGFMAQIS